MINEAMENVNGISFNGSNITNLRYADDAALVADTEKKLQKMMDKLNNTCKNYGMDINVKKTKVMVISNERKEKCAVTLDDKILEQVSTYKYLGSWIKEDARCEEDIRARIGMAKAAFWQNKELMRRNIRFCTKKKILDCYVFSILNYGCEGWTWNSAMCKKVDAFEMWCYRRMLKISWMDKVTNTEVLNRMQTKLHFMKNMRKRKMEYAGHVLRGSSGLTHLYILEGKVEGSRIRGRPRRDWSSDIMEWTDLNKYESIKRAAEDRVRWKSMVVNLLL
jgi:hypothetical protein